MGEVNGDRIRNVVLLGHSGAGKTTLAEALLARAGAIGRAGKVDEGTSTLDTEPESTKRKLSLSINFAPFTWTDAGQTYQINLLDTPGYPDFVGEVDAALSVADLAVLVVSAVDGVQVHSELLWKRAGALGLPRLVFVNKEDKERADFHAVLDELRAKLGHGFVALELPLGEATALHGIADVLTDKALEYEPGGTHHDEAMPDDVADEEHRLHDELVEEIVSGDDEQLEHYLAGDVPTTEELERTLAREVREGTEFPVLVGSALTGIGVDRLADFVCELGPSPADRPVAVEAGPTDAPVGAEVPCDPAGPVVIRVYKTITDPFVGQLSMFKVLSGTVRTDVHLVNTRTGQDERLHALFRVRGKEQQPVSELVAGDLGAVAKLADTATDDTLADKSHKVRVPRRAGVPPQHSVAVAPATQADDDKLGSALTRLIAEDPAVIVERVEETHQTVIRGAGETHVAVLLERLARKFGVHVITEPVRVPYRETIVGSAQATGRVKKQTGGHGQFAVVELRLAPRGRGEGFEFVDSIVGGAIPRNYLPAVHKGIEEAMAGGGVFGFPVVDVTVECYDGKYHAVDSSDMAFKTAAAQGLRDGLAAAQPVVLEPVSVVEVTVPGDHQGDVMGDISTRRGKVQGSSAGDGGEQTITATVPTSELASYAVDLRSMTAGRGSFTARHAHYEVLPAHLVDKVVAAAKPAKGDSPAKDADAKHDKHDKHR